MEKFKIISAESMNPHHYLGMKQMWVEGKERLKVRVYIPTATEVAIAPLKESHKMYPLEHKGEGIFEGVLGRRKKCFLYRVYCKDQEGNTWDFIDSYQFEQSFDGYELYLFGEGTNYKIHHKLGAHFEVRQGVEGVNFAVWAPHAKRVSVVGDFNLWDGRRHQMRLIPSNGIWELFIPELSSGVAYKYEIKTQEDHIVYKADPYASYAEVRPKTASRVWRQDSYTWTDEDWLQKRRTKKPYKEAVAIYEVHIGSWKKHYDDSHYTYRVLADHLVDYVKEMGYTHVELIGVLEHPFDGSWGYQVTGYFAPTSRYGTPDDFKYLVDTMHANGIGVILDWVPAHFPKDAFALEQFDGTALYEHALPIQANHPQWGTLIFNYGRNEVKLFLIASALSWIEQYHIDGLRVDAVASMLYLDYGREDDNYVRNKHGGRENLEAVDFIQMLNKVIYSYDEGIMMIAEESTSWPNVTRPTYENNGLGFGFKWNMGWMNDLLSYMQCDPLFRKNHHNKLTFSIMYAFTEHFILPLSHDEVVHGKSSMLYKMPGDEWQKFANLRLLYGYMYMHPGKKMLFMGNDFAQTREWSEKRELDWYLLQYPPHQKLNDYVKDLNHFYRQNEALWEQDDTYDGFEWLACDQADESLVVFVRKAKTSKQKLIVVANFTPEVRYDYEVSVDEAGIYEECLSSDASYYFGSGQINTEKQTQPSEKSQGNEQCIRLTVPPLAISVWRLKK